MNNNTNSLTSNLTGIDLINCVKANAKQGINTVIKQSGYGNDFYTFFVNLKQACEDIGVKINTWEDVVTDQQIAKHTKVIEFAPENFSNL